METPLY